MALEIIKMKARGFLCKFPSVGMPRKRGAADRFRAQLRAENRVQKRLSDWGIHRVRISKPRRRRLGIWCSNIRHILRESAREQQARHGRLHLYKPAFAGDEDLLYGSCDRFSNDHVRKSTLDDGLP